MIITIIHLVKLVKKKTLKKTKFWRNFEWCKTGKYQWTYCKQMNIIAMRNKFNFFESEASKHLDILLISETKMSNFSQYNFLQDGFSRPYNRLDHCANSRGMLLYARDDISSCLLIEYRLQDNTDCLFIKINLRKMKWFFRCSSNPNENNISKHTQ